MKRVNEISLIQLNAMLKTHPHHEHYRRRPSRRPEPQKGHWTVGQEARVFYLPEQR